VEVNSSQALPPLSEAQLEIMNFVWDHGEVSVAQVWKELNSRRNVARMIVRLRDKGWLRERIEGSAYWYRAAKRRKGIQRQMVTKLLDTAFAGSTEGLVMALLNGRQLSEEEADRIRKLIDESQL